MSHIGDEPAIPRAMDDTRTTVEYLHPGLLFIRFRGHLDEEVAARVQREVEAGWPRNRSVDVYMDGATFSYTNGARKMMIDLFRPRLDHTQGITMYTRSAIVRMGAAVASLALGGIVKVVSDQRMFESRLESARLRR